MKEQEAQLTKVQEAHEKYTKYFANEYASALQAKHKVDERNKDTLKEAKEAIKEEIDLHGRSARMQEIILALKEHNTEANKKDIQGLLDLINAKHDLIETDEMIAELAKEADKANEKILKAYENHQDQVKQLKDENALLAAEINNATETELLQLAVRQKNTGATKEQIAELDKLIAKNQELKEQLETKETNEEEATKKKEDDDQAVTDLVNDLGLLKDAQKEYEDNVKKLNIALGTGEIDLEQYGEGLRKLRTILLESTEEGKIAIEGFERVQDLLFNGMADALTGAEEGWKGFRDSLKDIVRDIIAQLLKLQAQQAITKFMGQGGGSGGGGFGLGDILSFGSSLFGGGGGGGAINPNSSGGLGNIFGYANGGSLSPRQPSIVGEKGPELFVPHTSGGIFTNRSLNNMGGGGVSVNQTINIETGVSQTVRAEMLSLLPQIKSETIGAVIDSKKRGGQMAETFS
jgi:hypothetical protein